MKKKLEDYLTFKLMTVEQKEALRDLIWEEGNKKDFEYKGYKCQIRRMKGSMIHLCGYVVLSVGHWAHGLSYRQVESVMDVSVHGGLTYARSDDNGEFSIGFDCAHLGDIYNIDYTHEGDEYRDMVYVENEIKRLVDQIDAIKGLPSTFNITLQTALEYDVPLKELTPLL